MMDKRTADTMTVAALRDLDPAPPTVLTGPERERADARFARIVAAPGDAPLLVQPDRSRWRRRRLLLPLGLAGAAAATSALLLGGGSAFASWTPKPEPLTAAAATKAAAMCRDSLAMPDHGERVVIAERRGGWTYVLIAGPTAEGACLMHDGLDGHQHAADRHAGFFGTYDTDPADAPTVGPRHIVETGSTAGSVPTPGLLPFTTDDGWFTWVNGYVGSDVVGVTVHPPVGPDVEASVKGGRFSAWWPGGEVSGHNPGVSGAWTYTVTLVDGSTRRTTG